MSAGVIQTVTSDLSPNCCCFSVCLQNSKYREEVLDLSSRNLQLSNNNAELSARLHGDQDSVRKLQEHLAMVSKEQEEERSTVRGSDEQLNVLVIFLFLFYIQTETFSLCVQRKDSR